MIKKFWSNFPKVSKVFTVINIFSFKYLGSGRNKTDAKNEAADKMLQIIQSDYTSNVYI